MGVLPAESGTCLPMKCQVMMRHPQSPIIDFYPNDFALDMNGKRWYEVKRLTTAKQSFPDVS